PGSEQGLSPSETVEEDMAMDTSALLAYLRTLGEPLTLSADDRKLPAALQDFLTGVPGRRLVVAAGGGDGLRLAGRRPRERRGHAAVGLDPLHRRRPRDRRRHRAPAAERRGAGPGHGDL